MSLRTQWPYAAKAIVQHEWVVNLLYVWVTFKFGMKQTAKPAHNLWLCEIDGAPKAVTVSAWQDAFTLLLTVPNVLALPARVTLEYDGPSVDLKITWDKQWEPWGPILSVRVPYGWEDILVVDTVNKRVGVQPGVAAAAILNYAFTVVSPDGNDQIGLYHDNTHAYLTWTDGNLHLETDEGVNTNTAVIIRGKGTGNGTFQVHSGTVDARLACSAFAGVAIMQAEGGGATELRNQGIADHPVTYFILATEGETPELKVYGYRAGDAKRSLEIGVGVDAADTASFDGLSDYLFNGKSLITSGKLVSGTLTHSAIGPTDNLDIESVNTVFIDCSGGNVTIGGFINGVNGQILHIVRLCAAANDATLEHNEAHAFQKIFLHKGLDETLTGEYGGWTLVCNGTSWFDASHAKHV